MEAAAQRRARAFDRTSDAVAKRLQGEVDESRRRLERLDG
jgi:endonuclease III